MNTQKQTGGINYAEAEAEDKEVFNVMKDMVEKDQQQFMHLLFEKDLVPKFAKQMNAPKVETNMLQNKPTMEASKVPG